MKCVRRGSMGRSTCCNRPTTCSGASSKATSFPVSGTRHRHHGLQRVGARTAHWQPFRGDDLPRRRSAADDRPLPARNIRALPGGRRRVATDRRPGGSTVPQLAIAWLLGRPGVSTAAAGARTVPEIEENVVGTNRQVSAEDMVAADGTREVFESLPRVPDMFQNWETGSCNVVATSGMSLPAARLPKQSS